MGRDYKWGHHRQSRPISKLLVYTVNVAFPHISSKLKKNIPVCGDKISAALRSIGLHRSWAKHRHHFNQKLGGMIFSRRLIPWSTVGGGEKWRKRLRTDNCESSAIRDFTFMRDLSYLAALLLSLRIKRFRKFGQIIFFRISHRLFSPFATFSNLLKFFIFPFAGQLPFWGKWNFESRWLFRDKPVGWMLSQI